MTIPPGTRVREKPVNVYGYRTKQRYATVEKDVGAWLCVQFDDEKGGCAFDRNDFEVVTGPSELERLQAENARLRAVVNAARTLCHNPKERWHEPEWVFRDELKAALAALDKDGG